GGASHRVVTRHVDPRKSPLLQELVGRFPPERGYVLPLPWGEAAFRPQISDEALADLAQNQTHLKLLQQVGTCSVLVQPLRARGRVLGVLNLVRSGPAHRYHPLDMRFADNFATRVALALD